MASPTPDDINLFAARKRRHDAIVRGDEIPTIEDRRSGLPPYRDSVTADLRQLALTRLAAENDGDELHHCWVALADAPGLDTALRVRDLVDQYDHETVYQLDWLIALLGDDDARQRVVYAGVGTSNRRWLSALMISAFALGLGRTMARDVYEPGRVDAILQRGLDCLMSLSSYVQSHALVQLGEIEPADDRTAEEKAIAALFEAAMEDRAEIDRDDDEPAERTSMLVVPPIDPEKLSGSRKEIAKSWKGLAGVALPLRARGDVAEHARSLTARWPHAAAIIETILGDLAARESVHLRPTLLVGKPGSGKSALATAIADQLRLPVELVSLGGAADSSLMGTSAQWWSARESVPLQLVKKSGVANPMLVWDEVEKAASNRHNGSALDALLGLLEVDQARQYRDPCLEVVVDLSMISHLATANDLDQVPAPLRDRMRVLVMPDPTWQHLPVLSKQIVARIAGERGIDPRWISPLAEDELDLVRQAWPGGSLRQLTRIITVIVDGRDSQIGRA